MSDLPSGWEWATLDELAAPEERSITDGPFGSNLKSAHYTSAGVRVLRLQNIGDGDFRDERAYISEEHFEHLRAHEARHGDLLIASLSDAPPRACLLPRIDGRAIVKADCIRVRLNSAVDPQWVLYTLLSPTTKQYAVSLVKGVGRPRLGLAQIRTIPVPVPPLPEQRRIVAALDSQLSRIEAGRNSIADARQRERAMVSAIRSWRIAERPVAHGTLADVVEKVEAGRSFGAANRPAEPGEWGIIKVSAMTWGEFRPGENKVVVDNSRIEPRFEIGAGDILISRANTIEHVGAPVLVGHTPPRLLLSDKSLRLTPKPEVDPDWLVEVLSSPDVRGQIAEKSTGNQESMRNISQSALMSVRIPLHEAHTQREIALKIREERTAVARLGSGLRRAELLSAVLRRAVLTEAFTGRLVPQDPTDEPASALLDRIRAERAAQPKPRRTRSQSP